MKWWGGGGGVGAADRGLGPAATDPVRAQYIGVHKVCHVAVLGAEEETVVVVRVADH